jgi:hypothetical protein
MNSVNGGVMRTLALLGLFVSGCDADKPTQSIPADTPPDTTDTTDTTPTDTTPTDTAETDTTPTDTAGGGDTADTAGDTAEVGPCAGREEGTTVGMCPVNFSLLDADGTVHELHSYAGRVLLVDFSGFT